MRGTTKCAAVLAVLLVATMVSGCKGCTEPPRELESVEILGGNEVEVGGSVHLTASLQYAENIDEPADIELGYKPVYQWSVAPSDGATISSQGDGAVFAATKEGDYTVTVTVTAGDQKVTGDVGVSVMPSGVTVPTEVTETTETTTTTVAETFAGSYTGSWLWTAGQSKADVPWAFVVDDQDSLKGGFDTMLSADTKVVCVLTGQVSDDGKVDASGTADTTISGVGSTSTPMTLTGQIASGKFTGKLVGSGGKAIEVTATRQ